jgi:hypothetical protein
MPTTTANRDDVLQAANRRADSADSQRVFYVGEFDADGYAYGVQYTGAAIGSLVRVTVLGRSARWPNTLRVRFTYGRDDSRADNAVTFDSRCATITGILALD